LKKFILELFRFLVSDAQPELAKKKKKTKKQQKKTPDYSTPEKLDTDSISLPPMIIQQRSNRQLKATAPLG
jgi:hypothetical protein